jgi:hypothetical protein
MENTTPHLISFGECLGDCGLIENVATFQIAVSKDAAANLQERSPVWNHPNLQRRKTRQAFS